MEKLGDAPFGPADRIGQLKMLRLGMADTRAKLEICAKSGLVSIGEGGEMFRIEGGKE